ncbi:MAG: hypothetical protein M3296_07450 [Actinomycetota bacterium]|nr:hypothetical protein [Actinomycetota bacterium]
MPSPRATRSEGPRRARTATAALGTLALAVAGRRLRRSPSVWLARMSGTTIAAPDAAGWMTDFLNAPTTRAPGRCATSRTCASPSRCSPLAGTGSATAGCERPTCWPSTGRSAARLRDGPRAPRGTLDREQLLAGAARLLGPWFPDAYFDDARRTYGITFESIQERERFRPELRLRHVRLEKPTPPQRPLGEQVWHTYEPVRASSAERVIAALSRPETWPDYTTNLGRFIPARSGGLPGQLFEIEIFAPVTPRTPAFVRGYVTVTAVRTREGGDDLDAYARDLNDRMVRAGRDQPTPFPDGATPLLAIELTTHEGHFMGRGRNRLLLYEQDGQAHLRAAGTWDDMPVSLEQAYRMIGRQAQTSFWGERRPEASMLRQIADRIAAA